MTVYNLHGKNYIFTLQPTCHPIVPLACFAVASKTKKNILITLKVVPLPGPQSMQTFSIDIYWYCVSAACMSSRRTGCNGCLLAAYS